MGKREIMNQGTPEKNTNYDRGTECEIRVYLDTDTYEVLRTEGEAHDAGYAISDRASEWFRNYALRGYVHEDDLKAYLLFTERGAMRELASQKKEKNVLTFRRKIDQEFHYAAMEVCADESSTDAQPVVRVNIRDLREL